MTTRASRTRTGAIVILRLAYLGALAALTAIGCGEARGAVTTAEGAGPAQIGEPRPAFEFETLDGGLVTEARVAGRVLVVDFFATWCAPCHDALADLIVAARDAALSEVTFVLVDLDEPAETVRRFAARAQLPPRAIVALDPNGVAFHRWGARKLPTTFIVDASGIVRHINRGWGPGYRERVTRWLRETAARNGRVPPSAIEPKPAH